MSEVTFHKDGTISSTSDHADKRIAELEAERIHFEAVAMTAIEENEKLEAEVENLYKASQFWIVACGERYDWFQESLRENAKLRESLAEIREIYTGSEGIPQPETAAEAYVLRLVEQMYNAAVDALQGGDTAGGE